MENTETTQPSLDGLGVSDGFDVSGDFVIVTDPAAGPEATINERWYRLYSHSKAMCELMVAFNSELEPGYAPQGLGVAVHDQLSKLENLATAARILITPAIAATGEWKRDGAPNPERWFAGKTGKSPAKARAEMETGKNLENAPGTREAFKNGELSSEQADTIADAVEANPEAEQALLDAAKKQSLKELKDEAARRKAEVEDMEEREKRIHKKRYLRTWTDREGAWNLHAKGTIPDGADFMSVLERLIDQQFNQARKNGVRGTRDNHCFDALMNMGTQHGHGNPGPTDLGPTGPGPDDPGPTNPGPDDQGPTDPGPADFGPNGPGPIIPGPTNPGSAGNPPADRDESGPGPTIPVPTDPGRSGNGPSGPAPTERRAEDDRPAGSEGSGSRRAGPTDSPVGSPSAVAGKRRSSRSTGRRLIYCVDWEALVRGRARIGERCELRGGGPVSVSAVRRALGVGSAKLLVTDDDGRVVTVAHLGTGKINLRLIPGLLDAGRRDSDDSALDDAGLGQFRCLRPDSHDGFEADSHDRSVGATVIIRVRADLLTEPSGGLPIPGPTAVTIPGLGCVSHTRALAVLGSEVFARLVSRGEAVRSLTYTGRAPNAAQRLALAWADTTCKVEACPNQRIEVDHRRPWATNRVTELDNLDPLCSHHHDLKSQQGWQFVAGTNRFVPPEDPEHPPERDGTSGSSLDEAAGQ